MLYWFRLFFKQLQNYFILQRVKQTIYLHAKYVPSRCLHFIKSYSTFNFLLLRSRSGKKKDKIDDMKITLKLLT